MTENSVPVVTKWLLDSTGDVGRSLIKSVYMLLCQKTMSKGTSFLLDNGIVISNYHVVEGASASDLVGISNTGESIGFNRMTVDQNRDLVALEPKDTLSGGLGIRREDDVQVGTQVSAWGYPLGYNGPAPLLSVGYLSGFNDSPPYEETKSIVKHLVVNGAFNPGNSGGPLVVSGDDRVIGVVLSKHAPLTQFIASAIKALSQTKSGVVFNYKDQNGNDRAMVEAQVVAEILKYFRNLTQVMIGEAVASSELIGFLEDQKIV